MSDKEKVSGEEVEVFYECREIGEGDWTPCDLRRYTYCQKQPEMDTRAFVPLYQHTRITEALIDDARYNYQLALDWQDKVIALQTERDQLRAELDSIKRMAECGTVQNWLKLPDEDKAKWFSLMVYTDSETWQGPAAVHEELARYRASTRDRACSFLDSNWARSPTICSCC